MKRYMALPLIALLLSACAGSAKESADDPDVPAEAFFLEVVADDFSFELRDTVPAGLIDIQLENTGTEPHQALIYKLNEGVVYEDYLKAVMDDDSQFPALSERSGGVNYGLSAGDTETYSESDPYEPGTYAVVCFIRETKSGKNHYELGMISPLTVE